MNLGIHLYRHFVVLAEELHYGRAAARLHIVQPALTRSIKVLESELGVTLLDRTSRRVALTPAGSAFLVRAREALILFDEAALTARQVDIGVVAMPLKIGFGAAAMYRFIPEVLKRFHERHKQVAIAVAEVSPTQVIEQLNSRALDLAIVHREYLAGQPVVTRPLYTAGLVAAVPAAWPIARRRGIRLRELHDLPFIFTPPTAAPMTYAVTMSVCSRCGLSVQPKWTVQGMHSILCMVASGLGYTLLNDGMGSFPMRDIAYVRITDPEAQRLFTIDCAWRADHESPTLRQLLVTMDAVVGR